MGNSLGCLPASHITISEKISYDFKCLILVSPKISCLKLLMNNNSKIVNNITQILLQNNKNNKNNLTYKSGNENNNICNENDEKNQNKSNNDFFYLKYSKKNSKNNNEFNFPIFLINSKKEESINYITSLEFVKKFKVENSWFPSNFDFSNLNQLSRKKFYEKLKEFFNKILNKGSCESFCNFSIGENNKNFVNKNYSYNKILMRFLKNKSREESFIHKEDFKNEIFENNYLIEIEESNIKRLLFIINFCII